jgi:hypothetical protein
MSEQSLEQWIAEARELGVDAAKDAASWVYDGNSDREERARVLAMLRDGDPAAYECLPRRPDLSGEYAGDPTPRSLYEDVTGDPSGRSEEEEQETADALADAFEEGVSDTFDSECERLLIEFCEGGDQS